jgi:hypothetical protein
MITEPTALGISLTGTNTTCFGASTGSIDASVTGGTGPYTYNWTGPNGFSSLAEDLANIAAGTYSLTVTDANNCLLSQNIVISGRASSIDSYNGGPGDYQAANFTVTPFGERFTIDTGSGWARLRNATQMDLAPGASGDLIVYDMGIPYFVKRNNATGNSGSYGMMIITNGYRGENDNGAATKDSELMLLLSQGVEGPQELVLEGQHDQDQDQEQVGDTGTITSETRSRSRSASHDDSNTRSSKSTSNSNISSKSSKSSSSDSKAPGSGLRLRRGRHLRGFSS